MAKELLRPMQFSQGLSKRSLRAIDWNFCWIFLLPLCLLSIEDQWLFNEFGTIDPWFYFGYFLDLPQHLKTFHGAYYGTRLPWILSGLLANYFLSPLTAVYVLHFTFYYIAVISLYLLLKNTIGARVALFAAFLMGSYCLFLSAIGSNYVDGAGLTYLLLTQLMLTYGAQYQRNESFLGLAGVFFGCLIFTNLFLITFSPLIVIFYIFLNRKYMQHSIISSLRFFIFGLVALTLFLGSVNYLLGGSFLFFMPTVSWAKDFLVKGSNPWWSPLREWIRHAYWLVIPALSLLASIIFLLSPRIKKLGKDSFFWFFQLNLFLSICILIFWQMMGLNVLSLPYYSSYLIPFAFLAIGSQLTIILKDLTSHRFYLFFSGIVCALFFSYGAPVEWNIPGLLPISIILIVGILLINVFMKYLYYKEVGILLVCAVFGIFNFYMSSQADIPENWQVLKEPLYKKQSFLVLVKSIIAVKSLDPKGNSYFWYNINAPLGYIDNSVASAYLWGYRMFNLDFPNLLSDKSQMQHKAVIHDKIFILSNNENAIKQANQSLERIGFRAQLLNEKTIHEGAINYKIIYIELCSLKEIYPRC